MRGIPNKSKVQLLQNPRLWDGFDYYFVTNWQAKEVLTNLKGQGLDIALLRNGRCGVFILWVKMKRIIQEALWLSTVKYGPLLDRKSIG